MKRRASLISKDSLNNSSSKWIELKQIKYVNENGREMLWESAERKRQAGAAAIIAILEPSQKIILVRQFRPPTGGYVLEFPAGLMDENDRSPVQTALRELKEETGYIGTHVKTVPASFSSPGLSSESVYVIKLAVDERLPENLNPQAVQEETENIENFVVPLKKLSSFIEERVNEGDLIDSKLAMFACGIAFNI